jgi:monofunctional biosynthetic peptidoglycan transglycosylase
MELVFMVLATAEHWYRKDAVTNPIQAASIAAILPNPRRFTATSSSARKLYWESQK